MTIQNNIIIESKHEKPILIDLFFKESAAKNPIIIFCHGYKGFKDWGAWNLMAKAFTNVGFCFIKFNFSHNGGTIKQPIDFPDLEAFGNNNYTKELDDLESVIDWVFTKQNLGDLNNIILIGHSRAGGIVSIKTEEDTRINKVVTLAGVSDFRKRTSTTGDLESWRKDGVKYVLNGRTKQQMPHYFQFYTNFIENENRLTIKRAIENLKAPLLIIHGNADSSISVKEAKELHLWNAKSQLEIIDGANHVFGAHHPWTEDHLPKHLESAIGKIILFIGENNT